MRTTPCLLALLLACAACATAFQSGDTVVKYEGGGPAILSSAPSDGEYGLYARADVSPKVLLNLEEGAPLGFERVEGNLFAIGGERGIPLDREGFYYWRRRD